MSYKITVQYARDKTELPLKEEFEDLKEAKKFISEKINQEAVLKTKVIYRLYQNYDQLIEEFDSTKIEISSSAKDSQSSQGKSSKAGFKPTPFNMTPTPPGLPKKWLIDEDDDKDKKKDK